jgi:hypothetical protein
MGAFREAYERELKQIDILIKFSEKHVQNDRRTSAAKDGYLDRLSELYAQKAKVEKQVMMMRAVEEESVVNRTQSS